MATAKSATTKKTTTKTTTKTAGRKAAAKPVKRFRVTDEVFVWLDDEQGDIRIPLRFKMKLLRRINALEESDEIEQLFMLLDGLGDKTSVAQIDELDVFDAMELVEAYFAEFEAMNQARLGEQSRSSTK